MKRRSSFVKKRGFQCHSIVKFMVQIHKITIIKYNMYKHVDTQGWPCHGKHDNSGHPRSLHQPKLSSDMVSYVESCFFLEVSVDSICKMHVKKYIDIYATSRDMDLFLCRKDVVNIYTLLMKGNYQLHKKHKMSVNLRYRKHKMIFSFIKIPMVERSLL